MIKDTLPNLPVLSSLQSFTIYSDLPV